MDIALDHLRRQVVVDAHQQGAVVISRPPERARIEPAQMVGASIVKTRQLRVRGVITHLAAQQAVFIGQPDTRSHRNDKTTLLTQRETPHLLVEREYGVFRRRQMVAVDLAFQNIGPVERLLLGAPCRAFRQMPGVIQQQLRFSHDSSPK